VVASGVAYLPLGEFGDPPSPFANLLYVFLLYCEAMVYTLFELFDILNWQHESGHNRLARLFIYYLVLEL